METTKSENNTTQTAPEVGATADPNRYRRVLASLRKELAALPKESLVDITVDVPTAGMLVLRVARTWGPYRARIAALPELEVDQAQLDKIESFAQAAIQAHAEFITASGASNNLFQSLQEGTVLRETLITESAILVKRGLLPAGSIKDVDRQTGYRNVAVALTALATVLTDHWSTIEGKTGITSKELDDASLLAQKIYENAAARDDREPEKVEAALLRAQAFSALARAYAEMQRCLAFLAPADVERLAPSFHQGRGRSAARQGEEEVAAELLEPAVPPLTPATPPTGPNGLVLPSPFSE